MNQDFEASLLKKRRRLTRFLAQEMLVDYAEGHLDQERKAALEEFLPTCKSSQRELESIKSALHYVGELAKIEVTLELTQGVEQTKIGWHKWSEQLAWRNWPEMLRWAAEAIAISAVVVVAVSLLPMRQLASWLPKPVQEFVLAEVEKDRTPPPVEKIQNPIAVELAHPAPDLNESEVAPIQAEQPKPAAVAATQISAVKSPDKAKGPKGFVFRAFMSSATLDESTEEVKNLIASLGGDKAGQVELGWRKEAGTYFHFTLPESNYEELMSSLRTFGPVRIYKDPHWRVMPEGEIRIILFIEDGTRKK